MSLVFLIVAVTVSVSLAFTSLLDRLRSEYSNVLYERPYPNANNGSFPESK